MALGILSKLMLCRNKVFFLALSPFLFFFVPCRGFFFFLCLNCFSSLRMEAKSKRNPARFEEIATHGRFVNQYFWTRSNYTFWHPSAYTTVRAPHGRKHIWATEQAHFTMWLHSSSLSHNSTHRRPNLSLSLMSTDYWTFFLHFPVSTLQYPID